jgi:hypothetical protein
MYFHVCLGYAGSSMNQLPAENVNNISNPILVQYAHYMVSIRTYHQYKEKSGILALILLLGSCSLWLDRPPAYPENLGQGARILSEVYDALYLLELQYPDQLALSDIGYGASAGFPVGDATGGMAKAVVGDPALPIRLAVWKDPAVQQPAWGLIPVRITAAIHGNEELGTELVLALLEKACRENPTELAGLELHVIPIANPYGYLYATRYNHTIVDLNRNFPWAWGYENFQGKTPLDQPESRALAEHAVSRPFALSLSLHTGAYCIVMPWDYIGTESSKSPDYPSYTKETYLSRYSPAHEFLLSKAVLYDQYVEAAFSGTSGFSVFQGFDWYFAGGTETDFMYMLLGVPSYTVELSPYKYWKTRTATERELMVEGHLKALLAMLATSRQGIHGNLLGDTDPGVETRVNAVRLVDANESSRLIGGPDPVDYTSFGLVSVVDGSFTIPLAAGRYQLTVVRNGVVLAKRLVDVAPEAGTYLEIDIFVP